MPRSRRFRRSLPYWLTAGTAGDALPMDHSTGENTEASVRTVVVSLDAEETPALLQECRPRTARRSTTCCSRRSREAMAAWTGGDRLRVDLEGHGREDIVRRSRSLPHRRVVHDASSRSPLDLPADASEASALKAVEGTASGAPRSRAELTGCCAIWTPRPARDCRRCLEPTCSSTISGSSTRWWPVRRSSVSRRNPPVPGAPHAVRVRTCSR